jgi:hypothetical protein
MTLDQIHDVLESVRYRDWKFVVRYEENSFRPYLQVSFVADGAPQSGRKWFLSTHMTKSEVVQTALKAILTAEEHEAREKFLYRGRAIFGPHFDVDALHEIVERRDLREEK